MKKVLLILGFFSFIYANVFLNTQEKQWIKKHSLIKIAITEIPNQVLKTKSGYQGFSIDLFKLISKNTGLKFKYIYFDTWNELMNAFRNKKVDIVFLAQKTPSRLLFADFTDVVITQKNKIIVNINDPSYKTPLQLINKKVAVTKGSAIEEFLRSTYPKIIIIPTKNELESLELLNNNQVDAAISESIRASFYMKKYNLSNLIISNDLGYNYYLRIASLRDEPMLNVILTKAVDDLEKNIKALQFKWGYSKDTKLFFDMKLFIFISLIFSVVLFFSIYLYRINKKLKQEIEEKEEVLNRLRLMRNSRLNQMNEILSMIAHQWKQPLNNLSLIIQLLIMKYDEKSLDDKFIEYFKIHTKEQIDLMVQTINDFRDFFKISENKITFDVKEEIKKSIELVKPVFDVENINIVFHYIENENYLAIGYPNALRQIIINILNNAKDALIENHIEKKEVIVTLFNENDYILISIEDNAGGIPLHIIDKIFNPYFTTKKENGTGLGLYIAKLMIEEKMNGEIDVKNTSKGANFEIKLPKA